jgi:hypothetical protein
LPGAYGASLSSKRAFKPELAGVLAHDLAVTCFMPIELQARQPGNERFEHSLALDKRLLCGGFAVEMEEIEGVEDQPGRG